MQACHVDESRRCERQRDERARTPMRQPAPFHVTLHEIDEPFRLQKLPRVSQSTGTFVAASPPRPLRPRPPFFLGRPCADGWSTRGSRGGFRAAGNTQPAQHRSSCCAQACASGDRIVYERERLCSSPACCYKRCAGLRDMPAIHERWTYPVCDENDQTGG